MIPHVGSSERAGLQIGRQNPRRIERRMSVGHFIRRVSVSLGYGRGSLNMPFSVSPEPRASSSTQLSGLQSAALAPCGKEASIALARTLSTRHP